MVAAARDGPLADRFAAFLARPADLIVPTLVQLEVYRWLLRTCDKATAREAPAIDPSFETAMLSSEIAASAAELSLRCGLAQADAIVLATGMARGAVVVTSDKAFRNLPGTRYVED